MLKKPCRIAALLASLAAVAAMAVAVAPAGATVTPCTEAEKNANICVQLTAPFIGYHVSGTLVEGGQTINLPVTGGAFPNSHPGYTGFAIIALRSPLDPRFTGNFNQGSINNNCPRPPIFPFSEAIEALLKPCGNVSPPFTQEVEFPKGSGGHQIAGMTTEESPRETGCAPEFPLCSTPSGEFHTTAASNCPSPVLGTSLDCVHEAVNTTIQLGYSVVGPGNGAASKRVSQCETTEPVALALADNLTFEEFAFVGSRFVGSATIPSITCSGKNGNARGNQMTETFSGPSTYDLCVQPVVPPPAGVKLAGCPEF